MLSTLYSQSLLEEGHVGGIEAVASNRKRYEEATSFSQKICRKCISKCRIDYFDYIQMQINDNESLPFEFLCVLNTNMGKHRVSLDGKNDVVICQKRIGSCPDLSISHLYVSG